jgi:hypothetical protein
MKRKCFQQKKKHLPVLDDCLYTVISCCCWQICLAQILDQKRLPVNSNGAFPSVVIENDAVGGGGGLLAGGGGGQTGPGPSLLGSVDNVRT